MNGKVHGDCLRCTHKFFQSFRDYSRNTENSRQEHALLVLKTLSKAFSALWLDNKGIKYWQLQSPIFSLSLSLVSPCSVLLLPVRPQDIFYRVHTSCTLELILQFKINQPSTNSTSSIIHSSGNNPKAITTVGCL